MTAEHLIVIGRGKLIADTGVDEFVQRRVEEVGARAVARVPAAGRADRRPRRDRRPGRAVGGRDSRPELRAGRDARRRARDRPPRAECRRRHRSRRRSWSSPATRSSSTPTRRRRPRAAGGGGMSAGTRRHAGRPSHPAPRRAVGVDQAALGPLDALVAAGDAAADHRDRDPRLRRVRESLAAPQPGRPCATSIRCARASSASTSPSSRSACWACW